MFPEEGEIRGLHSIWIDAVNAGDLVRLLTLMTDDAVFLSPGQMPHGREGFSANFAAASERLIVRCSSELEEVVVVGEVAYARSRDALTVTPRSGGAVTQLAGYRITIYRRQPDNRWLLARDAHTLSQAQ
jgi:uncharacterized protein (TIGR02246 family)